MQKIHQEFFITVMRIVGGGELFNYILLKKMKKKCD